MRRLCFLSFSQLYGASLEISILTLQTEVARALPIPSNYEIVHDFILILKAILRKGTLRSDSTTAVDRAEIGVPTWPEDLVDIIILRG